MWKTPNFVQIRGTVAIKLSSGKSVTIPLVSGLFKHLRVEELPKVLTNIHALRKYTVEALRRAPWQIVREFPADWLMECLDQAELPDGRKRALLFLLDARECRNPASANP